MFEKYKVPAFFLVKNAVLAAFANGRSTGLVLDSGASMTSAVPVHEGYVLQQAIVKSPVGGDFITDLTKSFLEDKEKVDIIPAFMVGGKEETKPGEEAKWTKRSNLPEVTKSWNTYQVRNVVRDFQSSTLQVSDGPYKEEILASVPLQPYEFPNGFNNEYGVDRFKIPEALFDINFAKSTSAASVSGMLTAPHVVTTSVSL